MPLARAALAPAIAVVLATAVPHAAAADRGQPVPITFSDLAPASRVQRFLPRLQSLNGRVVRLAGYVAASDQPLHGAFYLCPLPVFLDEGGAGTGDLPPDSVRVTVAGRPGWTAPPAPRPIEVVGRLDLGYREEPDGQVSWVRLTVDPALAAVPPSR
jgi:hypothetical protein